MSEVRKRKVDKEEKKLKKLSKTNSTRDVKSIIQSPLVLIGCVIAVYFFSPYRIHISHGEAPYKSLIYGNTESGVSYSDLTSFAVKRDDSYIIPKFTPIKFEPKNGAEEKSFSLYKKARIVDNDDVIINLNKVSWTEFNIKGYIDKGRLKRGEDAYKAGGFNQQVSDDVAMDRDVPDTRLGDCPFLEYDDDLPTTSVIITFHNELRSTLLRTIISVIRKTPKSILKEIVLVDDASADPSIGEALTQIQQVRLVVNRERQGLIRARIRAAMVARGDTLTFLDSHVEVNEKWIEPLMTKIKHNPKMVVAPIIDVINKDNFDYIGADAHLSGGVSWAMVFRWDWMTNIEFRTLDHTIGIKSPTIAGGLFSIGKKWFHELGEYDDQMDIWGGENIEFSFRVWQCGGEMEILPCSRVGHVFRDDHPYDFGSKGANNVFVKNNNRFVHTWMDEYKDFYYGTRPQARSISPGDLSIRLYFRDSLQCKPFKWYMETVYPRQHMPERESVSWGHAKRGEYCLQTFEKKGIKYLGGGNCNQGLWNPNWQDMDIQSFVLKSKTGFFQQPVKQSGGTYRNLCWGVENSMGKPPIAGARIVLEECADDDDSHQRWEYHGTSLRLTDYPEWCMDATKIGSFKIQKCSGGQKQSILFEMLNI